MKNTSNFDFFLMNVQLLSCKLNCDLTCRNGNNDTVLHFAVNKEHLDIVQFFISDQHCDPNIPSDFGGTLLHYAAMKGHMDVAKYLTVEKHCDPVSRDTVYYTYPYMVTSR